MNVSTLLYFNGFLLILSGALYSSESYKFLSLIIFSLTILLSIFLSLVAKHNANLNRYRFVFLFSSLLFMLVSAILNSSLELFFGAFFFINIFLMYSFFNLNKTVFNFFDNPIKITFIIITIINIYYGFSFPFRGIFSNPNSLGGIYSMISIISAGVLLDKLIALKKIDYWLMAILISCIFFTLMSNSRIAFISSIFSIFSIVIYFFIKSLVIDRGIYLNKSYFKHTVFYTSIFFLVVIIFWEKINDIFIKKFLYKFSESDAGITDGRSEIWGAIIKNSKIFGHGRNSPHLDYYGFSAHNTFFSIYDQFGLLSFILFLLAIVFLIIQYSNIKNIKNYGFTPIFIISGFVFLSISESLINKTIMLSVFMVSNIFVFKRIK